MGIGSCWKFRFEWHNSGGACAAERQDEMGDEAHKGNVKGKRYIEKRPLKKLVLSAMTCYLLTLLSLFLPCFGRNDSFSMHQLKGDAPSIVACINLSCMYYTWMYASHLV